MIAAPLSHGSNPNSNMAGRRREDDFNLVAGPLGGGNDGTGRRSEDDPDLVVKAFDWQQTGSSDRAWITRSGDYAQHSANRVDAIYGGGQSVRRLTPTECERLQGFPDGWTLLDERTSDSRRYAALGDAVTVPVAEWIGRRIMARGGGDSTP